MIRRLRNRHRRASLALALLVPVGLAASLLSRPGSATLENAQGQEPDFTAGTLDFGELVMQCLVRSAPGGALTVELWPEGTASFPDLLLYWAADSPGETLAGNETLLGSFTPRTQQVFTLPEGANGDGPQGVLVLFSLAHGEIVGAADFAAYVPPALEAD